MIALATQARTAADLSRALTHDAGAMTRVVDQLEEMGLARRVRLERDYRRQRVELTAEGRRHAPGADPALRPQQELGQRARRVNCYAARLLPVPGAEVAA